MDRLMAIINAPWVGLVVGIALALASIVISILLYKLSKPVMRLRSLMGDVPVIGPTSRVGDGLELRFEGQSIPLVTSTSYGIWNDGTFTVRGNDIVEKDPLRLEIEAGKLLRATIEATTREVTGVMLVPEGQSRAIIRFDYLDPGDGFRIQVLHSGEPGGVRAVGTVRGLPKGVMPFVPAWGIGRVVATLLTVILAISSVIAIPFLNEIQYEIGHGLEPKIPISYVYLGLLFAMLSAAYIMWQFSSRRTLKGVPAIITEDPNLTDWERSLVLQKGGNPGVNDASFAKWLLFGKTR